MKTLLKYLKPYYFRMLVGLGIKVLGTVSELMIPYILSYILKSVIVHESVSLILYWGGLMVVCAAVACVANIIANRMAAKVSRQFTEGLRQDLFDKTLRLSARQTDRFTVPSLESRITTDTYNVHNFVGMMQRMGVRSPIMLIGGVTLTLIMDAYLSMVMIAVMPFVFGIVYFISRKGVPLYSKVQKKIDNMIRVVREDASGIRVIKAFSKEKYEHARFDKSNKELSGAEQHAGIVMGAVHPIMNLLMNLGIAAVIAISAPRVANHTSDPATVIAFMQYFTYVSTAMMALTRIFVMYSKCAASSGRIEEVLLCENEMTVADESIYPPVHNDCFIEFDSVSFSYEGGTNNLADISFRLRKGESLGIIGATGSGKSTLVKLLLRFYDVTDGSVRIDGRDVRTLKPEELYSLFGIVMQNDFIYADTIKENIKFGRDISDENIVHATKIAQAYDFITAFSDGFEHELAQKGSNLSGGQKQRVLISRALAGKSDILILDDSSSALDYKTEAALRTALREELSDITLVTVAQRVSAVKTCDLILVLDEGRIIGRGTHDELMESCVEYREISESQMGGAIID